MKLLENKQFVKIMSIILAVVVLFSATAGVTVGITKGEKIDYKSTAEEYNSSAPDTSQLYTALTKEQASSMLTELDVKLNTTIAQANIESLIYCDATVTAVGKILAEAVSKQICDIKFSAVKKDFPEAYNYITQLQSESKTWSDVDVIPFGLTAGDKEGFVKACGAIGEFMGNDMLTLIVKAPGIYNDVLVPVIESLHTEKMPSFLSFVMKTGLSGRKRIEFLANKLLTLIEPVKAAPLSHLCEMLPDFLLNYTKACEYTKQKQLNLTLPEVQYILDSVFSLLKLSGKTLDTDYISKLGTAEVVKSGRGKRVQINGDTTSVFLCLADYITGLFTYENNYSVVESIMMTGLKKLDEATSAGKLLYSAETNALVAELMSMLALSKNKHHNISAQQQADMHNSELTDSSALFSGILSRENVASLITSADSGIVSYFTDNNISVESIIYTDAIATAVSRLTALLTGKEFSAISFAALQKSFPEAYSYISSLKQENNSWDDVGVIPFGITPGDKAAFIKACGAGAEHFGDTLALCLMVSPTAYEDVLLPLLEALHTGPMPDLKSFISQQGLNSAKRMEIVTEKVLTITEPVKQTPITYLCQILPDLISGYNKAHEFSVANPDITLTGLKLPELNAFLNDIFKSFGLTLPEYDFNDIIKLSQASVADSGDRTGKRTELTGDVEAVFIALASYIVDVVSFENNTLAITSIATDLLGIDTSFIDNMIAAFRKADKIVDTL